MTVALLKTRDLVDSQAASLFIQKAVSPLGVKPSRRSSLRLGKVGFNSLSQLTYPALEDDLCLSDSSDSDDEEDVEAMLLAEMKALEEDEDDFLENLLIQELKKDSSASDSDSDFDDLF
ncbi:hypothetical protein L596_016586 [Steinernema carpocapsae]|uniref:Uncharacterized protein n=1 Tax=Steinernema carpocapsae TaxID=34508 RepID=A0A4V6A3G1_STECR|nr:hypothetical protein L596_016586 [Steinernema carpocapsae]